MTRELECEKCGARIQVRGSTAEAWHAGCPKRLPRTPLPRYRPVSAQSSEP